MTRLASTNARAAEEITKGITRASSASSGYHQGQVRQMKEKKGDKDAEFPLSS